MGLLRLQVEWRVRLLRRLALERGMNWNGLRARCSLRCELRHAAIPLTAVPFKELNELRGPCARAVDPVL